MTSRTNEYEQLLDFARTTPIDLYASITLLPTATHKEIDRAYRRAALALHPDKNRSDPDANDKFHNLQQAYDILKDESLRAEYDAIKIAKEARAKAKEGHDQRWRDMVNELEKGEKIHQKEDEVDKEEMQQRALAEIGRRMRLDLEEKRRSEREARERAEREAELHEAERAVRVRWDADVWPGGEVHEIMLMDRFGGEFGRAVDGVTIREGERKVRFRKGRHRRPAKTAIIVFKTVEFANQAIKSWEARKTQPDWEHWIVEWAEGKEPESFVQSEKLSRDEWVAFLVHEDQLLEQMVSHQLRRNQINSL